MRRLSIGALSIRTTSEYLNRDPDIGGKANGDHAGNWQLVEGFRNTETRWKVGQIQKHGLEKTKGIEPLINTGLIWESTIWISSPPPTLIYSIVSNM